MTGAWAGRRVQQARAFMERRLPAPCAAERHAPDCPGTLDGSTPWVVGHIHDRITHPELTWAVTNWRHEARTCSDSSGQAAVIANARAGLLKELNDAAANDPRFSPAATPLDAPLLPFSLPESTPRPRITSTTKAQPAAIQRDPMEVRSELAWDAERLREYPWMRDLLDVPDDATPPLAMTPPHPEAVGSYGWDVVTWAEAEHNITLRWWQRLAIVRQFEHREDGTLCWFEVLESAPRRAGKSTRIRAVATWRLSHAAVIGEVQNIIHCGNDLPICREIQRGAWRWAANRWGKGAVTQANGKECIENTTDGSRWLVRSQDGVYGYDAGLAVVDEAWDVKPDTVTEGLEPAMLERLWAQLHLTSTAHRRASSLMKSKIAAALADDDGRTLLLLWGALPQDDPADPDTWRRASPHWSEDRRRMIAAKYERAALGEADPQADDPDPMEGFRAQYLNIWSLTSAPPARGVPIVDRAAWGELTVRRPDRAPDAAAIESHFDAGVSVALAWRLADGAALIAAEAIEDLAMAGLVLTATGYTGKVTVGASLADDPALRGINTTPGTGRGLAAVLELSRLLADGQLAHDGSPDLATQVLGVRTVPGADGPRLASRGRVDGIKAAAWAAAAARTNPARRRSTRVLTASI